MNDRGAVSNHIDSCQESDRSELSPIHGPRRLRLQGQPAY